MTNSLRTGPNRPANAAFRQNPAPPSPAGTPPPDSLEAAAANPARAAGSNQPAEGRLRTPAYVSAAMPSPDAAKQMMLWRAMVGQDVDALQAALAQGASVHHKIWPGGALPVTYAAHVQVSVEILDVILRHRPSLQPGPGNALGMAPLQVAIESENVSGVRSLLRAGARLPQTPYWQARAYQSALFLARHSAPSQEMVRLLDEAHRAE